MKIELNTHFKPDECVLYCGNAVYASLQSREEPVTVEGYVRTWRVRALRRGLGKHFYVRVNNGKATLVTGISVATTFPCYKEANEIAQRLMETGTVIYTEVIELLSFEYEDDSYAT